MRAGPAGQHSGIVGHIAHFLHKSDLSSLFSSYSAACRRCCFHGNPAQVCSCLRQGGEGLCAARQVRALLAAAGGAPAALPGAVAGRLVAVEPVVQTEAVRRRIKFLGHLPLNGAPSGGAKCPMWTPT